MQREPKSTVHHQLNETMGKRRVSEQFYLILGIAGLVSAGAQKKKART